MSLQSEQVKQWRRDFKKRIVDSMGGCCQICGYDKCDGALELHHIDPNEKDFSISQIRANCKAWVKVAAELRKCILLCANCHREVHNNKTVLPTSYASFNEDYLDYKPKRAKDPCELCGTLKPKAQKYCSPSCAQKAIRRLDWDTIDIVSLYAQLKSKVALGKYLGISDKTAAKYLKRQMLNKQSPLI